MDSFEINKILGAVLFACLCLLSLNLAANAIFTPGRTEKPGYEIVVPEKGEAGQQVAAVAPDQPIEDAASVRGRQARRGISKNARPVIRLPRAAESGRPQSLRRLRAARASIAGFNYSAAMKGQGRRMDRRGPQQIPDKPKGFVPNTTMGFAGVPRATERADIIAYLDSLAEDAEAAAKSAVTPTTV